MPEGHVLVYGGTGALGTKCVSHFKTNEFWVITIDHINNNDSDFSLVIGKEDDVFIQESTIDVSIGDALAGNKLDAIICTAGGSVGGNAAKDLVRNAELMWKQNVSSSLIATSLASKYLKEGGILILAGAKAALEPTPGMIGYGIAKAAVHHLVVSLGAEGSGLPKESIATAMLPVIVDTPMNRKLIPNGDFSTWTPLEFLSELFLKWTKKQERPKSGSLCQLITKDSETQIIPV